MGIQYPSAQRTIFQLMDIVTLNNLQFVCDQINKKFTKIISYLFHTWDGTTSKQYERKLPERTTSENKNLWFQLSHNRCAIRDWNNLQNKLWIGITWLNWSQVFENKKIIVDRVDLKNTNSPLFRTKRLSIKIT